MEDEDYMEMKGGENYERVTSQAGVRTTVCKNRFEILCRDHAEVNEKTAVDELKAWLAKRREAEVRESGGVSEDVS